MQCPFCKTVVGEGASVCTGCQAEILYRATFKELLVAFACGGLVTWFFTAVAFSYLFDTFSLPPRIQIIVVNIALVIPIFVGIKAALYVRKKNTKPRFFREFRTR